MVENQLVATDVLGASAMLQHHATCHYVITLRYAFLQRYTEVGYSPLCMYYKLLLASYSLTKQRIIMIETSITYS